MNFLENQQVPISAYEVILTKMESRKYSQKTVPFELKMKILEAARQTGSGMNAQHWRFILVQDKKNLQRLAADSTTGQWIINADFAVIVVTNPQFWFHMIDAGRSIQSMQLAAWSFGVASGIYGGMNKQAMAKDYEIPENLNITAVVGFGYPVKPIKGKKDRKPLSEIAFAEKFGQPLIS